MTTTITLPAIVKLANTSDKKISFQPYHENFSVAIPAGNAVEFEVNTAGQFFYYEKQATEVGLVVTHPAELEQTKDTLIVIDLPSLVTLTNTDTNIVNFVPYRENFTVSIGVGDAIVLEATTVGQVLYYLAQAQVNKGIAVTFAVKS